MLDGFMYISVCLYSNMIKFYILSKNIKTFILKIWQHCDCMGVKGNVANYLCEQCDPRYYPKVRF